LNTFPRASEEYLSLLASRGLIAAVKIGKNWHVTSKALKDYISKSGRKLKRGKSKWKKEQKVEIQRTTRF
jgi:hypothetical protein